MGVYGSRERGHWDRNWNVYENGIVVAGLVKFVIVSCILLKKMHLNYFAKTKTLWALRRHGSHGPATFQQ